MLYIHLYLHKMFPVCKTSSHCYHGKSTEKQLFYQQTLFILLLLKFRQKNATCHVTKKLQSITPSIVNAFLRRKTKKFRLDL